MTHLILEFRNGGDGRLSEMNKPCGDAQYNRETSIRVIKEDPVDPNNKLRFLGGE